MSKAEVAVIDYRGTAIPVQDEYVAVSRMAEAMGLDWSGQRQLIARSPWSTGWTGIIPVRLPGDDRSREHFMLHRRRVPMWVANIDTGHIRDETVRATVIRWQQEIADVLADYYEGKRAPKAPAKPPRYRNGLPSTEFLVEAKQMGLKRVPSKYGDFEFDSSGVEYAVSLVKGAVDDALALNPTVERAEYLREDLEKKIRAQAGQPVPAPVLSLPPSMSGDNFVEPEKYRDDKPRG